MKMQRAAWILVGVLLLALLVWVANHTYWKEVTMPLPPKGEALTNPNYVAQLFANALGARAVRDETGSALPAPDAVILLYDFHWSLSVPRREALKRWVEAGGRLIVDRSLVGAEEDFRAWAGIERLTEDEIEEEEVEDEPAGEEEPQTAEEPPPPPELPPILGFRPPCKEALVMDGDGEPIPHPLGHELSICGFDSTGPLWTNRRLDWSVGDENGLQAVRVAVGRGSVTAINATPFRFRGMFDGGHGALFVLATQLQRGDAVHFRTESEHPSVFVLMWRYGAPVVALMLVFVVFALWRGTVRLGPVIAEPERARRSLAEQIRGTGQFALRFGRGEALRTAAVRALEEAARRRFPGFARLSAPDRASKLAELTRRDPEALSQALLFSGPRRPNELRSAIALLEAARRDLLVPGDAERVPK
jgi:hypothetical protein